MDRRHALAAFALGQWLPALQRGTAPPADAIRHAFDRGETFRVKVNHRGDWVLLRTNTTSGHIPG